MVLFLAATSLAVRGSGREVGIGEFWTVIKTDSVKGNGCNFLTSKTKQNISWSKPQ